MPIIDIVLLLVLAGFVFYGLFFGLIRTFGSLIGVVAGLYLSSLFYLTAFAWAKNLFLGHDFAGKIITFIILFTIINRLIGFIFALLDRTFDLLSVIPFLKTINRLAGAALGFLEGGLILGIALNYISQTPYTSYLSKSEFVPFLIGFSQAIIPLLPKLLEKVKNSV